MSIKIEAYELDTKIMPLMTNGLLIYGGVVTGKKRLILGVKKSAFLPCNVPNDDIILKKD